MIENRFKPGDFGLFEFYTGVNKQAVKFTIHATVKEMDKKRVYLEDNYGHVYLPKLSNVRNFIKQELTAQEEL